MSLNLSDKNQDDKLPTDACCFNCKHWIGKRRKDKAYCKLWNLGGKDAPFGHQRCPRWEKRSNARLSSKPKQPHFSPKVYKMLEQVSVTNSTTLDDTINYFNQNERTI